MPKFVASLMYCYEILGLKDSDIKCTTSSAPTRSDAAKSTKEYDDYNNAIINTVDDKKLAVYVSWEAQNGITESGNPAITSVTTEAASSGHIMFGAAGSYVLLPAVEGKKLVAVTISIYKATKSWSVTTKEGVGADNTDGAPSGGESLSFSTDGEKYTFNLSGTENNTSYALRNGNATSGIKLVEIVYQ